jgi:hypothetical protein
VLFLGVDWKRKGGEIAVDAIKWLNENGIKSVLHIVGIQELDSSIANLPYVDNVGRLNKNDATQYNRLIELIKGSHCMLLPTMAECAGIAFVEASAYGLPSFTHDTGGVKDYVMNGVNGYTLPLGSTAEDFGRKIKECVQNGELGKMSETAIELYKSTLNWDNWAKEVTKVLMKVAKVEG